MSRRKQKPKNPHAVALGKRGAQVRMKKISPERRREIARQAAIARWHTKEE